jgi:hypothetical protein
VIFRIHLLNDLKCIKYHYQVSYKQQVDLKKDFLFAGLAAGSAAPAVPL